MDKLIGQLMKVDTWDIVDVYVVEDSNSCRITLIRNDEN